MRMVSGVDGSGPDGEGEDGRAVGDDEGGIGKKVKEGEGWEEDEGRLCDLI